MRKRIDNAGRRLAETAPFLALFSKSPLDLCQIRSKVHAKCRAWLYRYTAVWPAEPKRTTTMELPRQLRERVEAMLEGQPLDAL
ncbi:hypothetical protein, partial [uncultured Bradyrhizobium sp.]|uniref:hypothetical protein n=1 Tax=uncultured Bradyrhizobium sp. TaxID=199684 RepID=UPI00261818EC